VTPYWRHVAETYDAISKQYDSWRWQKFWRLNEGPIISEIFSSEGKVSRSLDVGVGTGAYWELHNAYSQMAIGIDVSLGMLDVLLQRYSSAVILCASANSMPFRGCTFDRVLATRILTHFPDMAALLSEAWRVLIPGGALVISDVDPEHKYDAIRFPRVDEISDPMVLAPQKHPLQDLFAASSEIGFSVDRWWRLRYSDLRWQPAPGELSSISGCSSRYIFYVCVLRKPFLA
jgi:ubiquinone/menaquinone biosynthesis C-methylase UbiE